MKKGILWAVGIIIVLLIAIGLMTNTIVDYQWFREVGYLGVFFTSLKWKTAVFIPSFILFFFAIRLYISYVKKISLRIKKLSEVKNQDNRQARALNAITFAISLVLSMIFTGVFWYRILEFINASSFDVKDPLFNKDVSFYMFKLPLLQSIAGLFITIVVIFIIITVAVYGTMRTGEILREFKALIKGQGNAAVTFLARQLAVLGAVLMMLLAGVFYLKTLTLVYAGGGVVDGAGYTEVHVTLPMYRIIAICCLVAAVLTAVCILKKKIKPILIMVAALIVLTIAEDIAGDAVEKVVVTPNARDKEAKYIANNIEMTRNAYGLNNVQAMEFSVDNSLTASDIEQNSGTIDNIRVTEFKLTEDVYNQMQAIRTYYRFNDVDIDRYIIDGELRQVFVAPRELDVSGGDSRLQTWQNTHLFYTHGYGAVMSYTNQATSTGLPEYILEDIPVSENANIKLDMPQMYFGEMDYDYIIVNNKSDEIDYPTGNDNKENRYEGNSGVKLNAFNRLVYALHYKSPNFILSRDISSDSRIIMHRNIMDRISRIAPFLSYDQDPYLVVADGRMYWIVDAYTTSDRYPYSEKYNGINYICNSVKVVVDAYDGTVDFYLSNTTDGIAKTMNRIYGGIFKDLAQMPDALRSHLRYSEDVFNIQAKVYEKYHMDNVNTFYNGQDLWSIASYVDDNGNKYKSSAVYQVMKLPEHDKEEFILSIPYTVSGKENMVAWLAVRMDSQLGGMVAVNFPEDQGIYGPQQFESKLNTNTEISQSRSLWGQQGSQVMLGETTIIPIENSLMYVKSLYLKASGENSLPELKRVIVQYGDNIVMESTINKAMAVLFGEGEDDNPNQGNEIGNNESGKVDQATEDLIRQASELFNKAKESQKNGDWAAYGQYLSQLEQVLNTLEGSID